MIDLEKVGKRIAALRKERGYKGEALAEALDCSIDSLLCPRELFILEAVYTDGNTQVQVTRFLDDMVRDNTLNIYVNAAFVGASIN